MGMTPRTPVGRLARLTGQATEECDEFDGRRGGRPPADRITGRRRASVENHDGGREREVDRNDRLPLGHGRGRYDNLDAPAPPAGGRVGRPAVVPAAARRMIPRLGRHGGRRCTRDNPAVPGRATARAGQSGGEGQDAAGRAVALPPGHGRERHQSREQPGHPGTGCDTEQTHRDSSPPRPKLHVTGPRLTPTPLFGHPRRPMNSPREISLPARSAPCSANRMLRLSLYPARYPATRHSYR